MTTIARLAGTTVLTIAAMMLASTPSLPLSSVAIAMTAPLSPGGAVHV